MVVGSGRQRQPTAPQQAGEGSSLFPLLPLFGQNNITKPRRERSEREGSFQFEAQRAGRWRRGKKKKKEKARRHLPSSIKAGLTAVLSNFFNSLVVESWTNKWTEREGGATGRDE